MLQPRAVACGPSSPEVQRHQAPLGPGRTVPRAGGAKPSSRSQVVQAEDAGLAPRQPPRGYVVLLDGAVMTNGISPCGNVDIALAIGGDPIRTRDESEEERGHV